MGENHDNKNEQSYHIEKKNIKGYNKPKNVIDEILLQDKYPCGEYQIH